MGVPLSHDVGALAIGSTLALSGLVAIGALAIIGWATQSAIRLFCHHATHHSRSIQ